MHDKKADRIDPGFCRYAAETMLPLLLRLDHEISGVTSGDDIEYVHQSRVATRRIRAGLQIFASCLPNKQSRRWRREVRSITRALGEARDLDVQIEFISSFLADHVHDEHSSGILFYLGEKRTEDEPSKDEWSSVCNPDESSPTPGHEISSNLPDLIPSADPNRLGLELLLLRLTSRRAAIQPSVAAAAERFGASGVFEEMTTWLHELKVRAQIEEADASTPFGYQQAFLHIMVNMHELFLYEPWLSDPSMIHRHHEMRIAAKHLRYTLESFAGLFEDNLKSEIKTFKKLQDNLGEMHDCDVWIEFLDSFVHKERRASLRYFGNLSLFSLISTGLNTLLLDRRSERARLFESLHDLWYSLKDEGFWDRLEEKVSIPVQGSFREDGKACTEGPVSIAFISDVHANLPALEAVLEDARERGASAVLNAGDSIGYGAFPDEVVRVLRSSHVLSVIGNYDRSVLVKKWKNKRPKSRDKQIAMRYAYHNLSRENRGYLMGLPRTLRFTLRGISILVTHGSPDSITEYLVNGTPESRYKEIAASTGADIVVTGHAHLPSLRQVDGVWFVNCGSVGRTEDGDPRACYVLLTLDPFSIEHIRVPYDVDRAIAALRMRHLPESFTRIVSEGKPLDVVSEREE